MFKVIGNTDSTGIFWHQNKMSTHWKQMALLSLGIFGMSDTGLGDTTDATVRLCVMQIFTSSLLYAELNTAAHS